MSSQVIQLHSRADRVCRVGGSSAQAAGRPGPAVSIRVVTGLCRATDIVVLVTAAIVTAVVSSYASDVPPWQALLAGSAVAVVTSAVLAGRCDLYSLASLLKPLRHLWQACLCLSAGILVWAVTVHLLQGGVWATAASFGQPALWALASGAALLPVRWAVAARLNAHAATGRLSTRIALVGANSASLRFAQEVAKDPRLIVTGIYADRSAARFTWVRKSSRSSRCSPVRQRSCPLHHLGRHLGIGRLKPPAPGLVGLQEGHVRPRRQPVPACPGASLADGDRGFG